MTKLHIFQIYTPACALVAGWILLFYSLSFKVFSDCGDGGGGGGDTTTTTTTGGDAGSCHRQLYLEVRLPGALRAPGWSSTRSARSARSAWSVWSARSTRSTSSIRWTSTRPNPASHRPCLIYSRLLLLCRDGGASRLPGGGEEVPI